MKNTYEILRLTTEEKKGIEHILRMLPDWFGLEDALQTYVEDCKQLPVFGCFNQEQLVGFVAMKETSKETLELYVMGVLPDMRRQNIGRMLVKQVFVYAKLHHYLFLQVKTLSPIVQDVAYLQTYAFYRSMGFYDMEVLPLWDEWNPCLLMIRSLIE